jgi:thiamine-phosphate pyrophosphorylase
MHQRYLQLCLVSNLQSQSFDHYRSFLLKAIQGGVTCVQLREKMLSKPAFTQLALQFKKTLSAFRIPLIINDYVDIAKEINADGVHLGQTDLSVIQARHILGPDKIIGLSIESFHQLQIANKMSSLDYVAASAVFPSKSKQDCKMIWGLEGLKKICQLSSHPVMAIGGITQNNARSIIDAGASGLAVIGAIHEASNPGLAAAKLIQNIQEGMEKKNENTFKA